MTPQKYSKTGDPIKYEVVGDATNKMHYSWGVSEEDALRNYCKSKRLRVASMVRNERGCWVLTSPQGQTLKFWVG